MHHGHQSEPVKLTRTTLPSFAACATPARGSVSQVAACVVALKRNAPRTSKCFKCFIGFAVVNRTPGHFSFHRSNRRGLKYLRPASTHVFPPRRPRSRRLNARAFPHNEA